MRSRKSNGLPYPAAMQAGLPGEQYTDQVPEIPLALRRVCAPLLSCECASRILESGHSYPFYAATVQNDQAQLVEKSRLPFASSA